MKIVAWLLDPYVNLLILGRLTCDNCVGVMLAESILSARERSTKKCLGFVIATDSFHNTREVIHNRQRSKMGWCVVGCS